MTAIQPCQHETVRDNSFATARCFWTRQPNGTYEPGETEVRDEWDNQYECVDCDEVLFHDPETDRFLTEDEL